MYWRFHWHGNEFSADNAKSIGWGGWDEPECLACNGEGEVYRPATGGFAPCSECEGTGQRTALDGYSCCETPEELAEYFVEHVHFLPGANEGVVVCFQGRVVGFGCDGEPLVIPEMRKPKPRFLNPESVWACMERRSEK